jgi:hypothetical protein
MNRFKNHLIAAAVLTVLATIGTIMNSHQAAAQGPPGGMSVNIVNPIPLPVTGSVTSTVTGTVGLASGTTVGLASGTSVGLAAGASVNVTNPATAPVLSLNVNDPGRNPWQSLVEVTGCATAMVGCGFTATPIVPTGHRLVIEHVSFNTLGSSATAALVLLDRAIISPPATHRVSSFPANAPPGLGIVVADQPVLIFLNENEALNFDIAFNGSIGFIDVFVSGYLLDCTIAPCAAIAP